MQKIWCELIKPKKLEIERKTLNPEYAKFELKPLERGYGTTIGNTLRRILLSSLEGAAITKVKVEKIFHEFSAIPDVVEDVTQIVLNLKSLRVRYTGEGPSKIILEKKGESIVIGKDFECGQFVTVLTPDQHIATLGKDAHFKMECVVEKGRGYRSAEENKSPDDSVDMLVIDSLFSPIRKVNYSVVNARVGQRTDYDRLILEVWTDGSIGPKQAVSLAAKIMQDQLSIFVEGEREGEESTGGDPEADKPVHDEVLYKSLEEMQLSVRSANCLESADIKYMGELVQKTEDEILKTKNFGKKSFNEIKQLAESLGLQFGQELKDFPLREELEKMKREREEKGKF